MRKLENILRINKDSNLLLYSKYDNSKLYLALFKDDDIIYLKKYIVNKKVAYFIVRRLYNFIKEEIDINKININYNQNKTKSFEASGNNSKIIIKNINPKNFLS